MVWREHGPSTTYKMNETFGMFAAFLDARRHRGCILGKSPFGGQLGMRVTVVFKGWRRLPTYM